LCCAGKAADKNNPNILQITGDNISWCFFLLKVIKSQSSYFEDHKV
jgi:hypothetical protein